MTEQALQARREYKRNWAKANREKVKAQQERHWERVAEQAAKAAEETAQAAAQIPQSTASLTDQEQERAYRNALKVLNKVRAQGSGGTGD